jgi:hypothetical protein
VHGCFLLKRNGLILFYPFLAKHLVICYSCVLSYLTNKFIIFNIITLLVSFTIIAKIGKIPGVLLLCISLLALFEKLKTL